MKYYNSIKDRLDVVRSALSPVICEGAIRKGHDLMINNWVRWLNFQLYYYYMKWKEEHIIYLYIEFLSLTEQSCLMD